MLRRPTRVLALGAIVVAGLLYWKPIHSYLQTRDVLNRRELEVARLQKQNAQLQKRLVTVGEGGALIREARGLGMVKPGERLYIVKGIAAWRKKH